MKESELNKNIHSKNWAKVDDEIRTLIKSDENSLYQLQLFNLIDANYRQDYMIDLYDHMWKLALNLGRIKDAKNYLNYLIEHLITYKRVARLNTLRKEAAILLPKKELKKIDVVEIFSGKNSEISEDNYQLIGLHPERWRHVKLALKNYILIDSQWNLETWKYIYEYLLRFGQDNEVIQLIAEKNLRDRTSNFEVWNKYFLKLYAKYKIDTTELQKALNQIDTIETKIDFDQLALEIMESAESERKEIELKVVRQLKYSIDDYSTKDLKEMITAFTFLGMSEVVEFLCERIIENIDQLKDRISIFYVMSHSLLTCSKYYRAIDLARDVLMNEPLLRDEKVAFKYIVAEGNYQLKNIKQAYLEFEEILMIDPKHRLTKERIREIEESK